MSRSLSLVFVVALAGCSDDANTKDAPHAEAGVDSMCGSDVFYTGEYVDWDSMDGHFKGIFMATFAVEGDTTRSVKTAPNGRFLLCLPRGTGSLVDITPDPSAGSDFDYLPGVAAAEDALIGKGILTSARSFTSARRTSFFTAIGEPYDATKGQLLVHTTNTTAALSLSSAHAATQAYTGTPPAWGSGDAGTYVFFGNIALAGGTTTLSATPAVSGAGTYPLFAGKITYVEVAAP